MISNDATGSAAVEKIATVPVARAPVEEVTVAVNVTFCPNLDGSAEDGITVVRVDPAGRRVSCEAKKNRIFRTWSLP